MFTVEKIVLPNPKVVQEYADSVLSGRGVRLGIIRCNLMIEMIDIGIENAVAYRLEGKITEKEMTSILTLFKEKIEKGENL